VEINFCIILKIIWLCEIILLSLVYLNKLSIPLPDWALKFREPKTEIKFIGNV